MKQIFQALMAAGLLLSLAACGGSAAPDTFSDAFLEKLEYLLEETRGKKLSGKERKSFRQNEADWYARNSPRKRAETVAYWEGTYITYKKASRKEKSAFRSRLKQAYLNDMVTSLMTDNGASAWPTGPDAVYKKLQSAFKNRKDYIKAEAAKGEFSGLVFAHSAPNRKEFEAMAVHINGVVLNQKMASFQRQVSAMKAQHNAFMGSQRNVQSAINTFSMSSAVNACYVAGDCETEYFTDSQGRTRLRVNGDQTSVPFESVD